MVYLCKPTECPIPRVNPEPNYGLLVITEGLHRFIFGLKKKKSTILVRYVDDAGGCARVG